MRRPPLPALILTLIAVFCIPKHAVAETLNATVVSAQLHALWQSPDGSRLLTGGTDGALWSSTDTGLHWQQSEVTGNSRISSFADDGRNTVLAVADDYLLRSSDAGQHWQRVDLPAGFVVTQTRYHAKTRSWIASAGAGILQSRDQGATWQIVYRAQPKAPLLGVVETARGQLLVGGSPGQLFTSADGEHWRALSTTNAAFFARFVELPDHSGTLALWHDGNFTGISADAKRTWAGSTGQTGSPFSAILDTAHKQLLVGTALGEVLRSRDNGRTWQRSLIAERAYLTGIQVLPKSHDILVVGARATIARSSDGGASWNMLNGNQWASRLNALLVSPDERHQISVGSGGMMLRSDDGGAHWQTQRPDLARYISEVVNLPTPGSFQLIGYDGLVARSNTGGTDWQLVNTGMPSPVSLQSMLLDARGRLLVCGPVSTILRSADEGRTWSVRQPIPDAADGFLKQLVANGSTLLAMGSPGIIMRSTDDGQNWQATDSTPGDRGFAYTIALDPGLFLAARLDGLLLRSDDDGQHWKEVGSIAKGLSSLHFDSASRTTWAMGQSAFLRSDDLGLTWRNVALPEAAHVGYMLRTDKGSLLGFGDRGSIVRSVDQGNTWQQVGLINESSLRKPLQETGTHDIWVPGRDGTLLRSQDDGQHWSLIPTRTRAHLNRLAIDERTHNLIITGERLVRLPLEK